MHSSVTTLAVAVALFLNTAARLSARDKENRGKKTDLETAQSEKENQVAARDKAIEEALVHLGSHRKNLKRVRSNLSDGSPRALNGLAWHWATCAVDGHGNAAMAVTLAKEAVAAVPDDPWYRDTLAAAYARAGDFPEAIKTQEAAIKMARTKNPQEWPNYEFRLGQMAQRLATYRDGRWHREDADNPPRPQK